MRIFYLIYSLILLIFTKEKESIEEPVRLYKIEEKPKPSKIKKFINKIKKLDPLTICVIIGVIVLFIISTIIIFHTGSMESTRLYNNRLI